MSIFDLGITKLLKLVQSQKSPEHPDEEPLDIDSGIEPESPEAALEPVDTNIGIKKVGAWVGYAAMTPESNVSRTIETCKALGLKRLDIIVNDFSGDRSPTPFSTYDVKLIVRLASAANAAGLDVHLMSWIMPHEKFIRQAAEKLIPLATACEAKSIQWDAEEPWTQAKNPMSYQAAADLIAELFNGITMGVNGIGYTPTAKFGPLAEVCDYLVPQCYSTNTSGADPATVAPNYVKRWKKLFGNKPMVVGLAGYRQQGIKGHTVDSAVKAAFAGAEALDEVDEVIYWSLNQIRKDPAVFKAVKACAARKKLA